MDSSLWSFVFNYNPERAIPYPWERCLDLEVQFVFYRNVRDDTLIFDIRTRVNLGGGLHHFNDFWNELMQHDYFNYYPLFGSRSEINNDDRNFIIIPADCCGPRVYLLIPDFALRCPLCNDYVRRCIIRRGFRF